MTAGAAPPTMAAAVTVAHGGPEVIELHDDWPTPIPGPVEAVVRVAAAAVNNTDIWSREGAYGAPGDPDAVAGWRGVPLEFPRIQGIDVAGRVVEVGEGADRSWIGRRVLVDPAAVYVDGYPDQIVGSEVDGGFAAYHRCRVAQLHDVEGSPLDDAQLACLPTAYGTALGMIERAGCTAGERVLVTGSSGGVGLAAVQLLVARGCEVVARTSEAKAALLAEQGAAEVTVRGRDGLEATAPVDAVVDVVGGDELAPLVGRLRRGGRLVTAGAIAGPVVELDLRRLYLEQRTLIGSTMHTVEDFAALAAIARRGEVAPLVAERFALHQIGEAQARFVEKGFVGKLVLEP
ncbi:MAG: zinc-binding dehydrogenase [Acidimicrobiales bacterium]|nr:zinc-binding dehydrogenase [Acidimicrobiales bacterium]